MVVPVEHFGGNSDGSYEMERWLERYCPGCKHSSRKGEREERQGGLGCSLPVKAYLHPYTDIEEWSADAGDAVFDTVCFAREERPPSPLKGIRRGSRQAQGQEAML
jgi:hypothetical protein